MTDQLNIGIGKRIAYNDTPLKAGMTLSNGARLFIVIFLAAKSSLSRARILCRRQIWHSD